MKVQGWKCGDEKAKDENAEDESVRMKVQGWKCKDEISEDEISKDEKSEDEKAEDENARMKLRGWSVTQPNAGAWLDKTVYSMALEELLQSFSNLWSSFVLWSSL